MIANNLVKNTTMKLKNKIQWKSDKIENQQIERQSKEIDSI